MLQMFYLDVAYVFNSVFLVFQTYVASVLTVFRRMMQMFPLDVAKVDLVLHMLQ
jgi:hypothetical protein